jgi:hypothetical protein
VERAGLQRWLSELGAEGGARESKEALAAAAKAMHGPRPARGTQGGMRAGKTSMPSASDRQAVHGMLDAYPPCEYAPSVGGAGRADASRMQH